MHIMFSLYRCNLCIGMLKGHQSVFQATSNPCIQLEKHFHRVWIFLKKDWKSLPYSVVWRPPAPFKDFTFSPLLPLLPGIPFQPTQLWCCFSPFFQVPLQDQLFSEAFGLVPTEVKFKGNPKPVLPLPPLPPPPTSVSGFEGVSFRRIEIFPFVWPL